jgi:predicted nucleic acid-binding protein
MADYVLDLIRRDLGLPSRREWFERLATREPVNIPPASLRTIFTPPGPSGRPRSPPPSAWRRRPRTRTPRVTMPVVIDSSALVDLVVKTERAPAVAQAVGAPNKVAPVRRFSTVPLLAEAWTLRANVSAADACYVVLARILRCPLVTADRKLSLAPGLGVPLITV